MRERPAAARSARRRGRRALRGGARAARRGQRPLRDRPHARARSRLLHAHRVRVHLRRARRAERGGRAAAATTASSRARRSGDSRHGLGGRGRADPARGLQRRAEARHPPVRAVRGARRRRRGPRAGLRSGCSPRRVRRTQRRRWTSAGARSKASWGTPNALGARYVAIIGGAGRRAEGHAGRRAGGARRRTPSCTPCCAAITRC